MEDGDTFVANALIKARAALEETGLAAVADDSGLVVDALDGEPGIMSARWAGVHGDDARNNEKLMRLMAEVPEEKRTARFHSSVVLVWPDGSYLTGEGNCEGRIGFELRELMVLAMIPCSYPMTRRVVPWPSSPLRRKTLSLTDSMRCKSFPSALWRRVVN